LILGGSRFTQIEDGKDSYYKKTIEAALVKNPNGTDLNYNLGVMNLMLII
jgi:hypothetical protein